MDAAAAPGVIRRALGVAVLVLGAIFLWPIGDELARELPSWLLRRSPHDRHARDIQAEGLDRTEHGHAWLAAAERALESPDEVANVWTRSGVFDETHDAAYGWRFPVRRGQRLTIDVAFGQGAPFIDLYRHADGERLASAAEGSSRLTYDVGADADVVARIQPALGRTGPFRVFRHAHATLRFPVEGVTPRAVGSTFGAPRDEGRRPHEGIDIFAPRGTPVLAAADGWVTAQTTNPLGGNVVWVWSLRPRLALYYAHLDRHAVSPGEHVSTGDILGYVGNTGNAAGTTPHLHFGIYAPPDGAVDPLPYVCDAPCGERLMQPSRTRKGTRSDS